MNDVDLELLLYRILSGKIIFSYNGESYELRPPSNNIRYHAQLLYNNIINDEKYNDWIREEDLSYLLINLGLWTKDTQIIMKDIEKKIDKNKIELYKSASMPDRTRTIRKALNNYRNQLEGILTHKNDLYANTLEGYASSIKHEYIICHTLYYNNNTKVFANSINNNSSSYVQFNNLVNEVNKQNLSLTIYKQLARNGMWRSYWNCNKENIFNKAVSDWTDDQRTIVNMSRMYDNIYEHPECPGDNIIEDDDMLDGWVLDQQDKVKKAKKQASIDSLNPKLKNAQEVFLMANNEEDIEDIIGLNSPESLRRMKNTVNYVKAVGETPEFNLPDTQMELRNQASQMLKNRK